jgi:hypothetical protein
MALRFQSGISGCATQFGGRGRYRDSERRASGIKAFKKGGPIETPQVASRSELSEWGQVSCLAETRRGGGMRVTS